MAHLEQHDSFANGTCGARVTVGEMPEARPDPGVIAVAPVGIHTQ